MYWYSNSLGFKKVFAHLPAQAGNTQKSRRTHGRLYSIWQIVLCFLWVFVRFIFFTRLPAQPGNRRITEEYTEEILSKGLFCAFSVHSVFSVRFISSHACLGQQGIYGSHRIHGRLMLTLDSCSFAHKYFSCFKDFCHHNFLSRRFTFSGWRIKKSGHWKGSPSDQLNS